MTETNERPELGTTEAAVRSCVNLIALATHTDEEHLAYWLDCYYQLRVAHEGLVKRRPLVLEDLRISPVAADLAQAYAEAFAGPSRTPAPSDVNEKLAEGVGSAVKGGAVEFKLDTASIVEAAAAQKKKQSSADDGRAAKAAERREGEEADPRAGRMA